MSWGIFLGPSLVLLWFSLLSLLIFQRISHLQTFLTINHTSILYWISCFLKVTASFLVCFSGELSPISILCESGWERIFVKLTCLNLICTYNWWAAGWSCEAETGGCFSSGCWRLCFIFACHVVMLLRNLTSSSI